MRIALFLVFLLLVSPAVATAGFLDSVGKGLSDTADAVGDAVTTGANAVGNAASDGADAVTDVASGNKSRTEIDSMAADALRRLFAANRRAETLFDESFGYAVFDSRKVSFMFTTGFGAGVAVERGSGKRIYMKMASGGINVGMGAQWYQVVFLFETESDFWHFVDHGWAAGGGGSAVVLDEGAGVGARFDQGVAVFQMTDKGLMLAADLTGTKYWKDDDLNAE